jgi:hypothetical protein
MLQEQVNGGEWLLGTCTVLPMANNVPSNAFLNWLQMLKSDMLQEIINVSKHSCAVLPLALENWLLLAIQW